MLLLAPTFTVATANAVLPFGPGMFTMPSLVGVAASATMSGTSTDEAVSRRVFLGMGRNEHHCQAAPSRPRRVASVLVLVSRRLRCIAAELGIPGHLRLGQHRLGQEVRAKVSDPELALQAGDPCHARE